MDNRRLGKKGFFTGLSTFCKMLVLLFGGLCLLFAALLSVRNLVFGLSRQELAMFFAMLAGIVLLCALMLRTGINEWVFFAFLLAVAFALRLLYVLAVPTVPESDFGLLLQSAEKTAEGDFSWTKADSGYFFTWPYQIPFVLYEAAVLRLFNSVMAIKLLNVLFMTGSCALVYFIAAPAGKRAALCAMLFCAVYPDAIHLSSVLTNQHLSTFLLLLAVYFATREGTGMAVPAGLCLGLSELMRPEAVIVLAASLCMLVWLVARNAEGGGWKKLLLRCALMCGAYFIVTCGAAFTLTRLGIAPYGIGNNTPEWKFIVGLDFGGHGAYSEKYLYVLTMGDQAQRWAEAKRIIAESFQACQNPISYFAGKCNTMWIHPLGSMWSCAGVDVSTALAGGRFTVHDMFSALNMANIAVYPLIWLLALCSVPFIYKDSKTADIFRFALVAFVGFFLIYLVIEVQERYRYAVVPLVILLTVPCLARLQRKKREKPQYNKNNA